MWRKKIIHQGLGALLLVLTVATLSSAQPEAAVGTLEEVDDKSLIWIDEQGFFPASDLRVFDSRNTEILLYRLSLPTRVEYHYRYGAEGVELIRIEEIAQ